MYPHAAAMADEGKKHPKKVESKPNINNKEIKIELLEKDALKDQKILIVMLWSEDLDPYKSEDIHKNYMKMENVLIMLFGLLMDHLMMNYLMVLKKDFY